MFMKYGTVPKQVLKCFCGWQVVKIEEVSNNVEFEKLSQAHKRTRIFLPKVFCSLKGRSKETIA